jgi:hypothetical protein
MLSHEIRDSVQAYCERYTKGQIHASERAISSLEKAIRNVSTQSQVLKSIIDPFDRHFSADSRARTRAASRAHWSPVLPSLEHLRSVNLVMCTGPSNS